jgi:tetratricopeptide (TPR) repeat protein
MSTENPVEQSIEEQNVPKQRVIEEDVSTYVVSWTWLFGGVIFLAVAIVGLFGLYVVRASGMTNNVLNVAKQMLAEAEEAKTALKNETDASKRRELAQNSLKLRTNAANLLNDHRRSAATPNREILEEQYVILDGLYTDVGESATLSGTERGKQLMDLCGELVRTVPEIESIKYLTRMLELEWDRRNFAGILDRGKALLLADQRANGKENYDALRYLTMALFERLPVANYDPSSLMLSGASFPGEMDDLLKRVYQMKPEDIDIASRYAEFIVDVTRAPFARCATNDLLRKATKEERQATAKRIIDDMVARNAEKTRAYLIRYHFMSRYVQSSDLQDRANEDLQMVLKLEPSNPEALILSSRDAFLQSQIALRDKKVEDAEKWRKTGEEALRKAVADNPAYGVGYQYLGDFLINDGKPDEAVKTWEQGVRVSMRWGGEELVGRIVLVLLDQQKTDEVKSQLDVLSRILAEMRITRPQSVATVVNMRTLLTARLYVVESQIAQRKMEESKADINTPEARKIFTLIQQKRADALQLYDGLLKNFGTNTNDYIVEQSSVYFRLLPQSLIIAGGLKMDQGIWDSAVTYFNAAIPFPQVREQAMLAAANAFQQGGRTNESTNMLQLAAQQYPGDIAVRFAFANSLFRSQLAATNADPNALDTVKKELDYLELHRSEIRQPWVIDIRLVHLELAKASLSNSADTILAAQNEAVKKFRELEKKTFPPDEAGETKKYSDDQAFVAEMVGIYSSLSAIADFERLLPKLREFPEGEAAYYTARVNDCLRRDDKDGAISVIEDANGSDKLNSAQKERFFAVLQNLKGETTPEDAKTSMEKVYTQLRTTFDQNPESLKPQAFFMLANMALDREDMENAKLVCERLQKIEGASGTMWRYITIRMKLADKAPDFDKIRQMYQEIIAERPQWDAAYVLGSTLEDRFLELHPNDADSQAKMVAALQLAIKNGNTQALVWARLAGLYEQSGRSDDVKALMREAALRGIVLDAQTGQFPQPYSRMYSQIQEKIADEDAQNADIIARQCLKLAEKRNEKQELIFALNMAIGKAFFDASLFDSAKRHLTVAAQRGGPYVYPLAVCEAKSGEIDKGFSLLLDEINTTPSILPVLLPSVLVLMSQIKPSEAIFERIDRMMNRIEKGERLVLSGTLDASETDNEVPLGTKRVKSLIFRFPDSQTEIDPSMIRFVPPEKPAGTTGASVETPAAAPQE